MNNVHIEILDGDDDDVVFNTNETEEALRVKRKSPNETQWSSHRVDLLELPSPLSANYGLVLTPIPPTVSSTLNLSQVHTAANKPTSSSSLVSQPILRQPAIWADRRETYESRNSIRRNDALRALRTQLIPADQLKYRASSTASVDVSMQEADLASINPRDMTDDQLVRWRKKQHDDQWREFDSVHRKRCDQDFLYHFMFSDMHADPAACLRYFRLLSAVECLVIGRYGTHLATDVIARWRWYAIPCNWSPKAWRLAVEEARRQAQSVGAAEDNAISQLIDSWLRNPATKPKPPSYTKKKCEEWLLLTIIVHVPQFTSYLLSDKTNQSSSTSSEEESAKSTRSKSSSSLLIDRRGASMLLITGDGRQVNRPGQPLRFWSIAQLWNRVAHGQPMDPAIAPLSHLNHTIEGFTEPSPEVFCGPFTPLIASTMAPHEQTMAATPFEVVRYFVDQYPLVTRVMAPQTAMPSSNSSVFRPSDLLSSRF